MPATGPRIGIRELRTAYGLSIPDLVELIKQQGATVSADHISNVELGYKRASDPLLKAWCKALHLHVLNVEQPAPSTLAERLAS